MCANEIIQKKKCFSYELPRYTIEQLVKEVFDVSGSPLDSIGNHWKWAPGVRAPLEDGRRWQCPGPGYGGGGGGCPGRAGGAAGQGGTPGARYPPPVHTFTPHRAAGNHQRQHSRPVPRSTKVTKRENKTSFSTKLLFKC